MKHENAMATSEKRLMIQEANRLASGRAKVTVDPEDPRLWRVEAPGVFVEAHEPMTKLAWQTFLAEMFEDLPAITDEQAHAILPHVRAAVSALHKVWAECREVEKVLGRDLDGLEGIIQEMAVSLDHAESVDADYVRNALNDDDLVAEQDACPKCGERRLDFLVWQKGGKYVKCTTCGKRYAPLVN